MTNDDRLREANESAIRQEWREHQYRCGDLLVPPTVEVDRRFSVFTKTLSTLNEAAPKEATKATNNSPHENTDHILD
jgi:hypothetical protein